MLVAYCFSGEVIRIDELPSPGQLPPSIEVGEPMIGRLEYQTPQDPVEWPYGQSYYTHDELSFTIGDVTVEHTAGHRFAIYSLDNSSLIAFGGTTDSPEGFQPSYVGTDFALSLYLVKRTGDPGSPENVDFNLDKWEPERLMWRVSAGEAPWDDPTAGSEEPRYVEMSLDTFAPCGISAKSLRYVEDSDDLRNDKIEVAYRMPSNSEPVEVSLYWVVNDGWSGEQDDAWELWGNDRGLAWRIEDVTASDTHTIPISQFRDARPDGARTLLLHVDSRSPSGGTSFAGEVDEENEEDNFLALDTTLDIGITNLDWNYDEGGLDIAYQVENRYWAPPGIDVDIWWSGNPATPAVERATVNPGEKSKHIPATAFSPPPPGDTSAYVFIDSGDTLEEKNRDNNQQNTDSFKGGEPTIRVVTTPDDVRHKETFLLSFSLSHAAPVPLVYDLAWEERAPAYVRDYSNCGDLTDANTCPPAEARSSEPNRVTVPFGAEAIVFGQALARTWNWLPPRPEYEEMLEALHQSKQIDLLWKAISVATDQATSQARPVTRAVINQIKHALDQTKEQLQSDPLGEFYANMREWVEISYDAIVKPHGLATAFPTPPLSFFIGPKIEQWHAWADFKSTLNIIAQALDSAINVVASRPDSQVAMLPEVGRMLRQVSQQIILANMLYKKAIDPPDFGFQVFADPGVPLASADLEQPSLFVRRAETRSRAMTLQHAARVSQDKAIGAAMVGDVFWQSEQLLAESQFAHHAALAYSELFMTDRLVERWMDHTLEPGHEQKRAELLANGELPAELVDLLKDFGASQEDIAALTRIALVDRNEVADTRRLAAARGVQTIATANAATSSLAKAIALRTVELEKAILSIDAEQHQHLRERQDDVVAALNIPSGVAIGEVQSYLAEVRETMVQTNNYHELQEYLEFGYAAVVLLQQSVMTPTEIAASLSQQVAEGAVPLDIASAIDAELSTADALIKQGDFTGVFARFSTIEELVQSSTTMLNSEFGSELYRQVTFFDELASLRPELAFGRDQWSDKAIEVVRPVHLGFDTRIGIRLNPAAPPANRTHQQADMIVDLRATASQPYVLDVWIDWDADGAFTASERSRFSSESLAPDGISIVTLEIPNNAEVDQVNVRVCLSSAGVESVSCGAEGQLKDATIAVEANPFQNPAIVADVDDSGMVTALDALLIINVLNRSGASTVSLDPRNDSIFSLPAYPDVSGDGVVTAFDALLVINALARLSGDSQISSEGEFAPEIRGLDRGLDRPIAAAANSTGVIATPLPESDRAADLPTWNIADTHLPQIDPLQLEPRWRAQGHATFFARSVQADRSAAEEEAVDALASRRLALKRDREDPTALLDAAFASLRL